jgi:HAD superfamily hydrolase (TIGR01490 family)
VAAPRRRAALFDMDRTLVRKETASLYVRYQRDRGEASLRDAVQVFWWMLQYTAGVIDATGVAARASLRFSGMPEAELVERCARWFPRYVEEHVCALGREAVRRHKERGDLVAIATGASPYAARPLAERLGIEHVVSSELEVGADGCFTGNLIQPLCYGQGKVERTRRLANALDFELREATFYSDSFTDLPLLEAVGEPVAVNPDPRLRRVARRRGWRIERW